MVPKKVWRLLETVGSNSVYQFLGMGPDASLEDLRAAAQEKYASIHSQGSKDDAARAGAALAGLCQSAIFKNAQSKEAYDKEAKKRDPEAKASAAGAERRVAAGAAFSSFVGYIVKHARIISAIGITLTMLGIALGSISQADSIMAMLFLGALVFPCGFTALLYKAPLQRTYDAGAAGTILCMTRIITEKILVVSGFIEVEALFFLLRTANLMHGFRILGGTVLLCVFVSVLLRNAWHTKLLDMARPIFRWWIAKTARWPLPVRLGAHAMALGLLLVVPSIVFGVLFGVSEDSSGQSWQAYLGLSKQFFIAGVVLMLLPFLPKLMKFAWLMLKFLTLWAMSGSDIYRCQSCGARGSLEMFKGSWWGYECPACGSDLPPERE